MKKDIQPRSLAMTASVMFLLITAFGFFWLWRNAQPKGADTVGIQEKYQTVEINSVKRQAEDLVSGKQNLAQMPLKVPTSNIGRVDPFAAL